MYLKSRYFVLSLEQIKQGKIQLTKSFPVYIIVYNIHKKALPQAVSP